MNEWFQLVIKFNVICKCVCVIYYIHIYAILCIECFWKSTISQTVITELASWTQRLGIGVWNFIFTWYFYFSRFLHSALTTSRKTLQRAVASHCSTLLSSAVWTWQTSLVSVCMGFFTPGGCRATSQPSWSLLSFGWTPHLGLGVLVWPLVSRVLCQVLRKQGPASWRAEISLLDVEA